MLRKQIHYVGLQMLLILALLVAAVASDHSTQNLSACHPPANCLKADGREGARTHGPSVQQHPAAVSPSPPQLQSSLSQHHGNSCESEPVRPHVLHNTSMAKVQAALWRAREAISTALAGVRRGHDDGHQTAELDTLHSSSGSSSSSSSSSSSGGGSRNWVVGTGQFDPHAAVRYFAYLFGAGVVVTAANALFFDYYYSPLLIRHKLAVRTCSSHITRPWHEIMWINLVAIVVATFPPSLLGSIVWAEALWPMKCDSSLQIIPTLWSVCVTLLLHDAYYYWLHRAMHSSKWFYKEVHAMHHDPDVMLEARTGMVITAAEAFLSGGLFYAVTIVFNCVLFTQMVDGVHVFNLWVILMPILTTGMLGNIGHSGLKYQTHLPLLALNPLLLALLFPGTAHSAHDHQLHHERPGYNFALYFRHMDEWFGTAADAGRNKRAPSSLLLMTYNLTYYAAVSWAIAHYSWVLAALCSRTGLTAVAALALLPAAPGGWAWFRRLGLWDRVREVYGCTASCSLVLDPKQRYIFAYHPHGLLSRGWWLVYGVHGKDSPIADLRVSLAVHKLLLSIPLVKQCLSLIGCCSADKQTLLAKLSEGKRPTSVTLCPGGWAEARFARTNKVLLSKQLGFVRLAIETDAQLVPVLGIGEARIGGAGANMFAAALVLPAKSVPLHVVFGAPLSHKPGEDVAAFHSRYVTALLALGKQHGVELQVV